jgi:hypothetical protein
MSQCEGRQWMVDPECPWWAKLRRAESLIDEIRQRFRGAQQSREWLGDCSGDADEAVVYRIGLIEPISAGFAGLGRRRDPQPAVVTRPGCLSAGRAALWSAHRGCRANDGSYRSAFPARSSTIGRPRGTNRRSCAAGRSSGSGVRDDSLVRRAAEAISKRSREDAVGRSQEA